MRILIAPNAFKNSLPANEVADAIRLGIAQTAPGLDLECFPIGDGGDGTGALLIDHFHGKKIEMTVHDPLGRKVSSSYGLLGNNNTAIIEMANASGLRLLQPSERNILKSNSYGTGELIRDALHRNATMIVLCVGGSATVDGGSGALSALGYRFEDSNAQELDELPSSLVRLADIDLETVDSHLAKCRIMVLCDVENPLLGDHGSAAVFGPQKGAGPHEVDLLEECLRQLSEVILRKTGKDIAGIKHGGAAGGIAAGLAALAGAELVNGIDYFLALTNFDKSLDRADLVITGEGSIDIQTLDGKGPFGVALRAREKGKPVIGIAGRIPAEPNEKLNLYFQQLLSINDEPMNIETAILKTKENLIKTARRLGEALIQQQSGPK